MAELIFDDGTANLHPDLDGGMKGLVPRDPVTQQPGMYAAIPPANITLIPRGEWSDRIKDGERTKSFLSHIVRRGDGGNRIPSLDQNGQGYCWAYGSTSALLALRAKANQPYVRLSAHAVACKIKNFRDEGGWGALSMDFMLKNGVPSTDTWPEKSMSRANDRPETWKEAELYKPVDPFMDLASPVYNRDLSFDQMMTLLLQRIPVVIDLDWWGHCVVALDPVEPSPGKFGPRIWNSWGDGWSDGGMAVLLDAKGRPSNAVAPTSAIA